MKTVVHMVNGILNCPGDADNWNVEGVDWLHTHSDFYAVAIQYWAGPIDRVFGQTGRAIKLRDSLMQYKDQEWNHILIGHSNGCDVICDCINSYNELPVLNRVHLLCGATEDDFEINGLNNALIENRVGAVTAYCAGKDQALKLANTCFGRVLGYGSTGPLGFCGPQGVEPSVASRVNRVDWPEFGHSDCWSDEHFNETMGLFLDSK